MCILIGSSRSIVSLFAAEWLESERLIASVVTFRTNAKSIPAFVLMDGGRGRTEWMYAGLTDRVYERCAMPAAVGAASGDT